MFIALLKSAEERRDFLSVARKGGRSVYSIAESVGRTVGLSVQAHAHGEVCPADVKSRAASAVLSYI